MPLTQKLLLLLATTACATTDLDGRIARLRQEHEAQVQRLELVRAQIKEAEANQLEASRRADHARCLAEKMQLRASVAGRIAECARKDAEAAQCRAGNAEKKSKGTLFGTVVGAITGVGLVGSGLGWFFGSSSGEACPSVSCEPPEKVRAAVLQEAGRGEARHCGGRLAVVVRNALTGVALVSEVTPGSPAAAAGLRKNDLLVTVGLCAANDFIQHTCTIPAGTSVAVDLVRGTDQLRLPVTLAGGVLGIVAARDPRVATIQVSDGVLVGETAPAGLGLLAGDRIVDVDGVPTWTVEAMNDALDERLPNTAVKLGVIRAQSPLTLDVTLESWPP